jgi:hypothetical protein
MGGKYVPEDFFPVPKHQEVQSDEQLLATFSAFAAAYNETQK